ncbi:MAG: DivIVA domain-containing protein, partial [Firmicutes bacterium]|nr:DivIVA domain-containing protein [Bacillota bacterium]
KLNDKVQNLEEALDYYKKLEETIKGSVILAEKAAAEAKNNANTTAEQIMKEAQLRGNAILQDANKRLYEMNARITELQNRYVSMKTKMRVLIKGQLEMLENIEIDDEDEEE